MSKTRKTTPLMEQYWGVKSAHPDKILLFRMGDFFEIFADDAETAAPILDIALTVRNKKSGDTTKMCGVPHHAIATPINKLLQAGFKVAICDQLEDPKEAKGLVKRGVTRILSPGMVYNPEDIEANNTNYIASYDKQHLSFLDASTGDCFYFQVSSSSEILQLMSVLQCSELVLSQEDKDRYLATKKNIGGPIVSQYDLSLDESEKLQSSYPRYPESAIRLIAYVCYMQGESTLKNLQNFEQRFNYNYLKLSDKLIRHLEIFETYDGKKKGSLFHAINRCKTSAGSRRLKNWLRFPLIQSEEILLRQDKIAFWIERESQDKKSGISYVRDLLAGMGDLERRLAKLSNPNFTPYDFRQISTALQVGIKLSNVAKIYNISDELLNLCQNLVNEIERIIVDDAPANLRQTGYIKKGVRPDLDEYIIYSTDAQKKLHEMEERERAKTGINNLKIRFNNVFGYYIEITNANKDKAPEHYIRKQTLVNSERYFTEELKQLEDKVLSAKQKRQELETKIFQDLKLSVLDASNELLLLAKLWSELDVHCGLAWLALEQSYTRPQINDENKFYAKAFRHPVLEQEIKNFVANDIFIHRGEHLLITGPNMAGKSTFMRQVASLALLTQIGSYVPAAEVNICLFDRIFTRIGASDSLSEGLSTFMVEMKEAAQVVQHLTEKSLVVMDELGRGTSTYDGMSLAQSILEYFAKQKNLISLFATHYHELVDLESEHPNIKNIHMAIRENSGELEFLYKTALGGANKSYGIQVARLAGLPTSITKRASEILQTLERHPEKSLLPQMDLFSAVSEDVVPEPEVVTELKQIDPMSLTPIEALNRIVQWQKDLS